MKRMVYYRTGTVAVIAAGPTEDIHIYHMDV